MSFEKKELLNTTSPNHHFLHIIATNMQCQITLEIFNLQSLFTNLHLRCISPMIIPWSFVSNHTWERTLKNTHLPRLICGFKRGLVIFLKKKFFYTVMSRVEKQPSFNNSKLTSEKAICISLLVDQTNRHLSLPC